MPKRLYLNILTAAGGDGNDDDNNDNNVFEGALMVTDGHLVPGKDKDCLYIVRIPGNGIYKWMDCLTETANLQGAPINMGESNWFYHRAVWMDLAGNS